ncbi:TetR/AcrR family transcriptional regulator [Aliinostoc sp. HNIBRCY26]|uniref:TetR/AcrR family transcriptional regulator n=1 Tax=Aliinostoc sp. HNIBRCY26 TaxID=3418997 RepID=UPI003CFF40FA
MARTPKITNQQILDAAREVFLQKGFSGSTLEIAQRAGISEASIFKRFATKEDLFFAAMGMPDTAPWIKELEVFCGQGDLKQNLVAIFLQILDFYSVVFPRMMMLRSRGMDLPEMRGKNAKPVQELKILMDFLEREMNQGRLRSCDAQALAHMIMGALMNYVFLGQISSPMTSPTHSPQTGIELHQSVKSSTATRLFVENLVEIVWQGIAPH